ncbi:nucleotide exchange factor GrpE [Aestuariispira ectoiniformans]|uniref:nucleotide exchange factor GrpE n=1 Tax=Aestuariispira ectoiniformans TaxID=2775080 RepID=UPI00223B41B4|nr:nucleotide exchange factor GrpE [Aestuariispira ectoiniformans]
MSEEKKVQDADVENQADVHATEEDVPANDTQTGEAENSELAVLDKLQAENSELKDRLMRALAEVENVRRRADKERQDGQKYAVSPLAKELLPVADNLRRALEAIPGDLAQGDDQIKNMVMGIEMTEKQLLDAFEKVNIQRVNPQGEKFDYQLHQAMSEAEGTGQPAGTVVQVLQAGYVLADRLLRPAMVVVAKGDPEEGASVDTTA